MRSVSSRPEPVNLSNKRAAYPKPIIMETSPAQLQKYPAVLHFRPAPPKAKLTTTATCSISQCLQKMT